MLNNSLLLDYLILGLSSYCDSQSIARPLLIIFETNPPRPAPRKTLSP